MMMVMVMMMMMLVTVMRMMMTVMMMMMMMMVIMQEIQLQNPYHIGDSSTSQVEEAFTTNEKLDDGLVVRLHEIRESALPVGLISTGPTSTCQFVPTGVPDVFPELESRHGCPFLHLRGFPFQKILKKSIIKNLQAP